VLLPVSIEQTRVSTGVLFAGLRAPAVKVWAFCYPNP
jgi:hypothetical protein